MSAVAALVLAAGASTRLGEPKQLVTLAGEKLLERAVRMAREAGLAPVVVVLGAQAERIRHECALGDVVLTINADWGEGMGASLRVGAGCIPMGHGAVVMTCDQPAVTVDHLRLLAAQNVVTASEYAGRRGVPAYFPPAFLAELVQMHGDTGARGLLREARSVDLSGGELDIDTEESLQEARARFS